jgi:hypothetical protein
VYRCHDHLQEDTAQKLEQARNNSTAARAKLDTIRTVEQRQARTGFSVTAAAAAAKAKSAVDAKAAKAAESQNKVLKGLYSDVSSFAVLRGMEQLQAMAVSPATQQQVAAKAEMYYDGNLSRAKRAFNTGLKDMFDHLANAIRHATSKVDETFEKTVRLCVVPTRTSTAAARRHRRCTIAEPTHWWRRTPERRVVFFLSVFLSAFVAVLCVVAPAFCR